MNLKSVLKWGLVVLAAFAAVAVVNYDPHPQTYSPGMVIPSATELDGPERTVYREGVYQLGSDIQAGEYRTSGSSDCYYARLSSSNTNDIITNNFTPGPQRMTLEPSDWGVQFSGACVWSAG